MARPNLKAHRKFRRLVLMLEMPAAHVRGHLEYLWESAYENGDEIMGDATDVELAAGWIGDPGKLAKALAECGGETRVGFIELVDGEYRVHDLWDHAPEYVQKRRQRELERQEAGIELSKRLPKGGRRREKNAEWRKTAGDGGQNLPNGGQRQKTADIGGQRQTFSDYGKPPAPAPAHAHVSIGDVDELPFTELPSATSADASAAPASAPGEKKPKTTKSAIVDESFLDSLVSNQAYAGIDVRREYGKMMAWLETPRGRGKHPTRTRFIGWLNRCEPKDGIAIPERRKPNQLEDWQIQSMDLDYRRRFDKIMTAEQKAAWAAMHPYEAKQFEEARHG